MQVRQRHRPRSSLPDGPPERVRELQRRVVTSTGVVGQRPLGVVPERERPDRYRGYDPGTVDELADCGDPMLVKTDGARMREFKAPSDREPQIPSSADAVVPIASAHAVGQPLDDERVHRVDRVAALTGRDPGDELRPADVAVVLADENGGRKGVPDARRSFR